MAVTGNCPHCGTKLVGQAAWDTHYPGPCAVVQGKARKKAAAEKALKKAQRDRRGRHAK